MMGGGITQFIPVKGFPEAPEDGKTYGRKDGEWAEVGIPSSANFIVKTKTDLQVLISNSNLVPSAYYIITDFDENIYDDGSVDYATPVILQALDDTSLSELGYGLFYNPLYRNYNGTDMHNEDWYINPPYFSQNIVWNGSDGPVVDPNTNDIINVPFDIGDKAIWGGYVWEKIDDTLNDEDVVDNFTLNSNWVKITYIDGYQNNFYSKHYDNIKVSFDWNDLNNCRIVLRDNGTQKAIYKEIPFYNTIASKQFGRVNNEFDYTILGSTSIDINTPNTSNSQINYFDPIVLFKGVDDTIRDSSLLTVRGGIEYNLNNIELSNSRFYLFDGINYNIDRLSLRNSIINRTFLYDVEIGELKVSNSNFNLLLIAEGYIGSTTQLGNMRIVNCSCPNTTIEITNNPEITELSLSNLDIKTNSSFGFVEDLIGITYKLHNVISETYSENIFAIISPEKDTILFNDGTGVYEHWINQVKTIIFIHDGIDYVPHIKVNDRRGVERIFAINAKDGDTPINPDIYTVELIDILSTNFYASKEMEILEIDSLLATGTYTILVNDNPYTIGDTVNIGDKITISTDIADVYNVKSI